jgi:DnaJ-class molecular chaperone
MKNRKKMLWFTDRLVFMDTDFDKLDTKCRGCNGTGEVDELDKSRVNSQTESPPYHKSICNECGGSGIITKEEL